MKMKKHCRAPGRARRGAGAALGVAVAMYVFAGSRGTAPVEGLHQNTPGVHALVNARIVQAPGRVIEKGTVVLRDGVIEAVGADVKPPADARIWDLSGLTVYPGLIDLSSHYGLTGGEGTAAAPASAKPGGAGHWNPLVRPERDAAELFQPAPDAAAKYRAQGFAVALTSPPKGIFRGAGALVSTGDGSANAQVLIPRFAQHLAFESTSGDDYPSSLMGAIALIRQTFYDARWYQSAWDAYRKHPELERPENNESLVALRAAAAGKQPVVLEVSDELNSLRADKIAKEFDLNLWVRGSGYEYRRLDLIKQSGRPVIVPVNYPDEPDVDSPEDALNVSLDTLRHWDLAPENPKRLLDAGVPIALTADGLKDFGDFRKNVRKAIERGLPEDAALAALTTVPAHWLGKDGQIGAIAPGAIANLVVTDGPLFAEKTKVYDTWVDGVRYEITKRPDLDLRGKWQASLTFADGKTDSLGVELKGEPDKLNGAISKGDKSADLDEPTLQDRILSFTFKGKDLGYPGVTRMSATVSKSGWMGTGVTGDGTAFTWAASPMPPEPEKKPDDAAGAPPPPTPPPQRAEDEGGAPPSGGRAGATEQSEGVPTRLVGIGEGEPTTPEAASTPPPIETPVTYPPGAYGRTAPPDQPEWVLVKNATIWTSGPLGKLEGADLLVHRGKTEKVGPHLDAPKNARVIDGYGKHVTPGLIDAHSHTAISGEVNEGTHAVTAEVRIGDVVNPNDTYIYWQLAGGLTMAQIMHGSANPIGGQNQIIKFRWGASPEEMKYDHAPKVIKFALGENVKQSNWGDKYTTRYPQTRMGVEQVFRDSFQAARDYERAWDDYNKKRARGEAAIPPRRDLQLDALLEILHGQREIECHAYRQDEIEMLMRVTEDFGIHVGMFHHILEGYKVADQMAKHGAGATAFSDWWAYKIEVYDAIPYNGALMHDVGVIVSFNSDSGEMARRLNVEAAKAVKYGGLSEEEALKFVTINPAKQYHMDKWVGSLEPGKDADFVVWNGDPLSDFSHAEQTWIDGRKYFDIEEDHRMRIEVQNERERLIQKVLAADKKEAKCPEGCVPKTGEDAAPLESGREPE